MKKLLLLFTIIFLCGCDSMYVEDTQPVVYYHMYVPNYYYYDYYPPRVIYRPRVYVTPRYNTTPRRVHPQHRIPHNRLHNHKR